MEARIAVKTSVLCIDMEARIAVKISVLNIDMEARIAMKTSVLSLTWWTGRQLDRQTDSNTTSVLSC